MNSGNLFSQAASKVNGCSFPNPEAQPQAKPIG
jgi:hypothetical protein